MIYNFSAGPAILPDPVIKEVQASLLDYKQSGSSILSLSHRSTYFLDIIAETTALFTELMHIPDNYAILFMQGGASTQFATVPMNLMHRYKQAAYFDTGVWSTKAAKEAEKFGQVAIPFSGKGFKYNTIPSTLGITYPEDIDYLHITTNNTIYGTCYPAIPNTGNVPLVADMSSDILSKPYQVTDFDLIYAGAQKNLGPSGLAIVIINKNLLGTIPASVPSIFNYAIIHDHGSLYNTPNTFAIYVCNLVLKWLKSTGGVSAIHEINQIKAKKVYDYLDNSKIFKAHVSDASRSIMNIPFTTGSEILDNAFIEYAHSKGLIQLKGHRTIGGIRASIYNAMPIEGVEKLISTMCEFESQHL